MQKLGKSLVGGLQQRTGSVGVFQRREVTSWNSGGEAAAQRSSAEVSLWVCVWGGGVTVEGANTASCQVEPQTKGPQAK